jgi:hypothetical protein
MKKTTALVIIVILAGVIFFLLPTFHISGPLTRAVDLSNLSQVAMACEFFATERNGAYPTHLGELFAPELGIFKDPKGAKSIFQRHGTSKETGDISELMEWTDWVYLPGHSDQSPPGSIILFLPPGHHYIDRKPVALAVSVDGTPKTLGLEEFTNGLNATLQILSVSESNANKSDAGNGGKPSGEERSP